MHRLATLLLPKDVTEASKKQQKAQIANVADIPIFSFSIIITFSNKCSCGYNKSSFTRRLFTFFMREIPSSHLLDKELKIYPFKLWHYRLFQPKLNPKLVRLLYLGGWKMEFHSCLFKLT